MSLFGNHSSGKSSLFTGSTGAPPPHHSFDWKAAALSFMGVDPNIFINRRHQQDAEAQQAQVNAIIDADQSLSPQDKAYAKLNPKAYLDNYMQRFQPMNTGPGGGSRGLPGPNGQIASWQTAPRFDDNGTIYGPGNGTTPPQILQRGTKTVPLQPGGMTDVRDAITGAQVMSDGSVPQAGVGPRAPMLSEPPETVKAYLKAHPETSDQFDQRYGVGAAAKILSNGGASPSNGSATFPGQ